MFLDEFWGKGYATEALKAYLDHYWSLERKGYVRTIGEGNGTETSSKDGEEEDMEVLRAIAEAGNLSSINVLQKCNFRETQRFLHENGAWRVDLVMERPRRS
jgi:RimJ/RimL family protein N-acetyltransferase